MFEFSNETKGLVRINVIAFDLRNLKYDLKSKIFYFLLGVSIIIKNRALHITLIKIKLIFIPWNDFHPCLVNNLLHSLELHRKQDLYSYTYCCSNKIKLWFNQILCLSHRFYSGVNIWSRLRPYRYGSLVSNLSHLLLFMRGHQNANTSFRVWRWAWMKNTFMHSL